jgi:putative membrane protein insertion efficiency factor
MKKILIKIIRIYQSIPGPWHQSCRHIPTCSNYAIEAIDTYGCFKGTWMAFKRIIRCNPWGSSGYDPVIKERKK